MELKFDYQYACENYNVNGKLVTRKEWSPVENCKHTCLVCMINMFTDKYINEKFIPADFEHTDGPIRDEKVTRCICSQFEPRITHHIIRHKETGFSFKIGRVCFENLFEKAYHEDILDFFKETCKHCKCKIKKRDPNREGFCNLKCKNIYDDHQGALDRKRWVIEWNLTKEARLEDDNLTNYQKWEHVQVIRLLKFHNIIS